MNKIFFITGASGVGKTTLLEQFKQKYAHKNWGFLHFDSIGVPEASSMVKEYGSQAAWQEAMTMNWIESLIHKYNFDCIFFEGQVNLNFIKQGFVRHNFTNYKIILVDAAEEEMAYRLTHQRLQPDLLNDDMKNWLKFLRQQAQAQNVPIIDTTGKSSEVVLAEFEKIIAI
jgi:GTPase SAR1 family protein